MMYFLRLLAITLLLSGLSRFPVCAQQYRSVTDSLKQRLIHQPADTNRVIMLNKLAFEYLNSRPDTTHRLAQQAYQLARQLGYLPGQAKGLDLMGTALAKLGDYPKSIRLYQQSLAISRSINDLNHISVVLNNLVTPYTAQKQYDLAIQTLRESFRIVEQANPSTAKKDTMVYGIMYCNLGEMFAGLHQLDSASHYLLKALPLTQRGAPRLILPNVLYVLGDVQKQRGNTKAALTYYYQAVSVANETVHLIAKADTYLRIAQLFQQTGQVDSSIVHARKSLITSQKLAYLDGILSASQLLAQLYEGRDNTQALRYYKVAVTAKDSLFSQEKVKQLLTISFEEQQGRQELAATKEAFQNRLYTYGLSGVVIVALLIAGLLWRTTRRQHRSNQLLSYQKTEIDQQRNNAEQALEELQRTQDRLIHQEKMASLGELTAGIAHEIQNPLNFVNNFADLSVELIDELAEERRQPNRDADLEDELLADIKQNIGKIHGHGRRADAIVKGMLAHSSVNSGQKEPANLNALAGEYLKIAHSGLRAKGKDRATGIAPAHRPEQDHINVAFVTDFDASVGNVEVVPQEIGRVLLNLYSNAFYALSQKQERSLAPAGEPGPALVAYQPVLTIRSRRIGEQVELTVEDNGTGMPEAVRQKIFQPFFTTKPTGEGTGLGLSLSYDIVTRGHGGTMSVDSSEGEYTRICIALPS